MKSCYQPICYNQDLKHIPPTCTKTIHHTADLISYNYEYAISYT